MRAGKFEYYEAKDGWRWRLFASNGQIIATGGEAYSSKQGCLKGIDSVIAHAKNVHEHKVCVASLPPSMLTHHDEGTVIVAESTDVVDDNG